MLFKVLRAENLPAGDANGSSDPFVKISYDGRELAQSPRVKRSLNPRWDFEVPLTLVHAGPLYVVLEIWDRDELSSNDLLGELRVPFPDWRPHVDEYQRRLERAAAAATAAAAHARRRQQQQQQQQQHAVGEMPPPHPMLLPQHASLGTIGEITSPRHSHSPAARSMPRQNGRGCGAAPAPELHRRSRSLNSFTAISRMDSGGDANYGRTSSASTVSTTPRGGASTPTSATATAGTPTAATQGVMDPIKPVFIWSTLVKGPIAQGRVLCSIEYEERDLKYLTNQPHGTSIYEVFLPQNPRFKHTYSHLPRSWHPDLRVRQQELSALHAGTPKDCLFPWDERLLHMVEEVTVTFHVNESNQGVLATLVLTNYRVWFVPYRRVKGLVHEDVHTISIGKILKASISQKKRGSNNNTVTVLELENMDAGHYHVTLSPISRLRDSVRDFSREAEAKRIKQLHNILAEIEWLKIENTFCAPNDLNHIVVDPNSGEELKPEELVQSVQPPPPPTPGLSRAATTHLQPTDHANVVNQFLPPPNSAPVEAPPARQPTLQHHVSASNMETTTSPNKKGIAPKQSPKPYHFAARRRIRYDAELEYRRQGALDHPRWRRCFSNEAYELCSTYPSFLMVPWNLSDDTVREAAKFRSKNRFPALTWIHPRTGAPLCRSSQPNTGVLRSNNSFDRDLVWAMRDAAIPVDAAQRSSQATPKKNSLIHIVDARPEINAKSNALAGKGHESVKQYDRDGTPMASITFMGIDNIHAVRSAFSGLTQALYEVEDSNFFGAVQKSHWLEYLCGILQGASEVANHLERGDAVLVHCSDGWDRTAQLCSLAQIMLDPYFRTLEGFAILIEKDWCSFGHMFKKRCGHPTSDQTSPIFPQFLDAVYQLTLQFPTHFQFNELFLSSIADAVYSSWYGTFQMNSERERRAFLSNVPSVSLWDVIRASTDQFLNPLFNGGESYGDGGSGSRMEPMLPVCRVRMMQLWCSQYQKAISHMRLQQREFEMLQLIRQQETELSRVYAVLSAEQQMELRAVQLRADISGLARSMNLTYPETSDASQNSKSVPASSPGLKQVHTMPGRPGGKRGVAASVDFHDLTSATTASSGDNVVVEIQQTRVERSGSVSPTSASSSSNNQGDSGQQPRRRSISRSRSNSIRLKNSLINMMNHISGTSAEKPNHANSENGHRSPQRHDERPSQQDTLKKELQSLESQLAKLNNQVAEKEDIARHMMRRFRCYNYNLPESVLNEAEATSPTNAGKALMNHRTSRHRASRSERFHSPSAYSPSSSASSSRDSPSPSSGRRNTQPAASGDSDDCPAITPGSTPLLTTTKVISSSGSFRVAQPIWERDVDAPCCKRCKKKFKTFYRNRHHCRCCGYVFCGRCTSNRMNLPEFGYYDVVRVCVTCYHSGEDG